MTSSSLIQTHLVVLSQTTPWANKRPKAATIEITIGVKTNHSQRADVFAGFVIVGDGYVGGDIREIGGAQNSDRYD
jgi:hypothetical protein